MAATLATFRTRFPEFVATADGDLDLALSDAAQLHDKSALATLYCAAHLLAIAAERPEVGPGEPDGGAGLVRAETIGPRRVQYINQIEDDEKRRAFYATTTYGRTFLAFEDRAPGRVISATVVG